MAIIDQVIDILDTAIVHSLVPLLLIVFLIELKYKNRFKTRKVLGLIRWFILSYAAITFVNYMIGVVLHPDESSFLNRAIGPYWLAYWAMFFCANLLPFTLFFKKLGTHIWYLILVAFCLKIGVYFERFIIVVTSIHRDFTPDTLNYNIIGFLSLAVIGMFLKGFMWAISLIGFYEVMDHKK